MGSGPRAGCRRSGGPLASLSPGPRGGRGGTSRGFSCAACLARPARPAASWELEGRGRAWLCPRPALERDRSCFGTTSRGKWAAGRAGGSARRRRRAGPARGSGRPSPAAGAELDPGAVRSAGRRRRRSVPGPFVPLPGPSGAWLAGPGAPAALPLPLIRLCCPAGTGDVPLGLPSSGSPRSPAARLLPLEHAGLGCSRTSPSSPGQVANSAGRAWPGRVAAARLRPWAGRGWRGSPAGRRRWVPTATRLSVPTPAGGWRGTQGWLAGRPSVRRFWNDSPYLDYFSIFFFKLKTNCPILWEPRVAHFPPTPPPHLGNLLSCIYFISIKKKKSFKNTCQGCQKF